MSVYWRWVIGVTVLVTVPVGGSLSVPAAPLVEGVSADGRCRVVLSVSPEQPFLADAITLTIDVICPNGDVAIFPPFGDTLGELDVDDIRQTDRQLILTATPRSAGPTPIWAMTILCGDRQIEIPGTELIVASAIDAENVSLDDIGLTTDIIPERSWHIYAIIAALVLTAVFLLWLLFRRKRADVPEDVPPLSAQELALQRLAALLESRTYESDVKGFFVELSDIVRWYVERLTGIRAPELTTEEFLRKIARPVRKWGAFVPESCPADSLESLAPFLEAADIVKFAKHVPTDDEIMLAFRRAEQFVGERRKESEDGSQKIRNLKLLTSVF